jgi:hypothetical protein
VAEVARSLEVAEGTLWNWMKADREAAERAADPNALSESERDELRRPHDGLLVGWGGATAPLDARFGGNGRGALGRGERHRSRCYYVEFRGFVGAVAASSRDPRSCRTP